MCSVIRDEFRLGNLGLNFDHPEYFTTPQWRWPRPVYLIYRFIMAAYTIFAFIDIVVVVEGIFNNDSNTSNNVTNVDQPLVQHAMAYLTIWTYLVLTCHFVLAFIITAACYRTSEQAKTEPHLASIKSSGSYHNSAFTPEQSLVKENHKSQKSDANENNVKNGDGSIVNPTFQQTDKVLLPWYSKISWVLSNILSVFAVIVTAIFFGALYNPSAGIPFHDVNVHALNTVFIVVDNFICARPVRLLHVIYPAVYGFAYVIFSAIYWAFDHRNVIYKLVLDWNYPGINVGVVAGITVLVILLQCLSFALYRLRLLIYKKIYGN